MTHAAGGWLVGTGGALGLRGPGSWAVQGRVKENLEYHGGGLDGALGGSCMLQIAVCVVWGIDAAVRAGWVTEMWSGECVSQGFTGCLLTRSCRSGNTDRCRDVCFCHLGAVLGAHSVASRQKLEDRAQAMI